MLFPIIVRSWWKLVEWIEVAVLLSLRICDLEQRVSFKELNIGGRGIAFWAPLVSF